MTTATPDAPPPQRTRPAAREFAIIGGFVVLVGIAVVTVLIPALRDDKGDEDEQTTQQSGAAPVPGAGGALPPATRGGRPPAGAVPAGPTAPVGP